MVTKITSPVTPLEVIGKVNEIIDDFTLDNLTNVSISSPSAGQNLTYDATNQVWKNTSSSATVAWGGITGTLSDQTDLNNALNGKVPTSRTINSKALTSDITLTASDVGALPDSTVIPTVDQTYDGTSANAQSGKAVASAISGKADDSDVVHKAGAETITGGKSFTQGTGNPYVNIIPAGGNIEIYGKNNNSGYIKFTRISGGDSYLTQNNGRLQVSSDGTNYYNIINSFDVDNSTITLNSSDQLQTVAVKDNRSGNAIKTWTGTKAQYDAITTKDSNTLYNITDDTDVTLTLLNTLYPVGAIYIGTMNACPLQALGVGTWQLVATDRVLQGAGTRGSVGTTVNESLPNIKGDLNIAVRGHTASGAFYNTNSGKVASVGASNEGTAFSASLSSSTYQDNAPVQQNAYLVNIWERIQ